MNNKCTLLNFMYLINARNMEDITLIRPTVYYGRKRRLLSSTANRRTEALKQEKFAARSLNSVSLNITFHSRRSFGNIRKIKCRILKSKPTERPPHCSPCSALLQTKGAQPKNFWLALNNHSFRIPTWIMTILAFRNPSRKIWGPSAINYAPAPPASNSKIHYSPSAIQTRAHSLLLKALIKKKLYIVNELTTKLCIQPSILIQFW